MEVSPAECQRILSALGCEIESSDEFQVVCVPPSWRSDLSREVDLIEEVARIHGYDRIPENVAVPMTASHRTDRDRSLAMIRNVLTANGFDEAMTPSLVPESWESRFSPWSNEASLRSQQPMEGVLDRGSQTAGPVCCLRRSLLASLVEARRINEFRGNESIELFEIAKAYLPRSGELPNEPLLLSMVSQACFFDVKGVLETLLEQLHVKQRFLARPSRDAYLDASRQTQLLLGDAVVGWLGELSESAKSESSLRYRCTVAELNLEVVLGAVELVPQQQALSPFPSIDRDFNFIVDESVRWSDLEATVNAACGDVLERVSFREVFRDPDKDGENKKRVLLSIRLRALNETLTGDRADLICQQVIDECKATHQARLLA